MRWPSRHTERLLRDARELGIGALDPGEVSARLAELAREAGHGIVRLEARRGADGRASLSGSVRGLGPNPPEWRAVASRIVHPGPRAAIGVKRAGDAVVEAARAEADRAGVDEALLFDAAGRLVEGARSAVVCVFDGDGARVPPLSRGGVASLARAVALATARGLEEGDVTRAELAGARELVALNAVRGARPIVRLDGAPVGSGAPGPWASRLAEALDREPEL